MANLQFGGSTKSGTEKHVLQVYMNDLDEVFIEIDSGQADGLHIPDWIVLDIDTAVQFAKQLRKVIAEAKEAQNG